MMKIVNMVIERELTVGVHVPSTNRDCDAVNEWMIAKIYEEGPQILWKFTRFLQNKRVKINMAFVVIVFVGYDL